MTHGNLTFFEEQFEKVGWFIPPFVTNGFLSHLAKTISDAGEQFSQDKLEQLIEPLFAPDHLAAMVVSRYPSMPVIQDYKVTIGEAVKAHFLGLDHVAVAGLVPVVEGAGRLLAKSRGIKSAKGVKALLRDLANDCKKQSQTEGFGKTDEVISMMDSFVRFADKYLFCDSSAYPLSDNTNRHGIGHGKYMDVDFGTPLNFYKILSAINFLTLVSAFKAPMSVFAPDPTSASERLATLYIALQTLKNAEHYNVSKAVPPISAS